MGHVWQLSKVSQDESCHVINQVPIYKMRYEQVLKFHAPGLAPAKDGSGAFHIDENGSSVYPQRYLRTFGFYEGLAAVHSSEGWLHIFPDGQEAYPERFAWCGNFQEGFSSVRDAKGNYFHINLQGKRSYNQVFCYVGDFREEMAVVQNHKGMHTHITPEGCLVHGKWFIDLDVYHKGFARAKDEKGWFHIDKKGNSIYSERYKNIEPFYNGMARVETEGGALCLIEESGERVGKLRENTEDVFHHVSAELVSYWRFYTLKAAHEFKLFEALPSSLPSSSKYKLLRALQEMGFVERKEDAGWILTEKGSFLQPQHRLSLFSALEVWKEEHLLSWQNLSYALLQEKSAFEHLFGQDYFKWLKDHPQKNKLYHQALSIYAKKDYEAFYSLVDLTQHSSLLDLGGSSGTFLMEILQKNLHLKGILLDLPHVIDLVQVPESLQERLQCLSADFFGKWPSIEVDAILLSRIIHDWPDKEAVEILKKASLALSSHPSRCIYVIENCLNEITGSCALLDLNMLVMTGGRERTFQEFTQLFKNAGMTLDAVYPLNSCAFVFQLRNPLL